MSRVLVTGGAGTIGAAVVQAAARRPGLRGARLRPAASRPSGCARAARCTPATCASSSRPAQRRSGCTHVIHLAAIVGGIANFHRLPAHAHRGQQRALQRRHPRGARRSRSSASCTCPPRWCSSARSCSRRPRTTSRDCPAPSSAYGFSKLTGEVYCRAAHDEHGLPFTICRPFNAYGPGEMPDAEPGIAHAVPDLIEKVLAGQRPLQIFGSGEQTRTLTHVDDIADGIVTAMSSPAGLNEDFNISASRELTVAEIAAIVWEACGEDPSALRARAPRRPSPSTCSAAGPRSRRRASCSAGRPAIESRTASPRRCAGCASRAEGARPRRRAQRRRTRGRPRRR